MCGCYYCVNRHIFYKYLKMQISQNKILLFIKLEQKIQHNFFMLMLNGHGHKPHCGRLTPPLSKRHLGPLTKQYINTFSIVCLGKQRIVNVHTAGGLYRCESSLLHSVKQLLTPQHRMTILMRTPTYCFITQKPKIHSITAQIVNFSTYSTQISTETQCDVPFKAFHTR